MILSCHSCVSGLLSAAVVSGLAMLLTCVAPIMAGELRLGVPIPANQYCRVGQRQAVVHSKPLCFSEGQYEVISTRYAEGAGELLVTTAIRLMNELHQRAANP